MKKIPNSGSWENEKEKKSSSLQENHTTKVKLAKTLKVEVKKLSTNKTVPK